MSDYNYSSGGGGCFNLLLLLFLGGMVLFLLLPGDYESTSSGNTRSGVLSGNQTEVLSRNQINIASEVQNCYGDYSCMTVISTTTTSESTTTSSTEVSGERNIVTSQWGQPMCWDESLQTHTSSACQAQGVQP